MNSLEEYALNLFQNTKTYSELIYYVNAYLDGKMPINYTDSLTISMKNFMMIDCLKLINTFGFIVEMAQIAYDYERNINVFNSPRIQSDLLKISDFKKRENIILNTFYDGIIGREFLCGMMPKRYIKDVVCEMLSVGNYIICIDEVIYRKNKQNKVEKVSAFENFYCLWSSESRMEDTLGVKYENVSIPSNRYILENNLKLLGKERWLPKLCYVNIVNLTTTSVSIVPYDLLNILSKINKKLGDFNPK